MTFDDACNAAAQLLDQRGTLVNAHLLRLVSGDKGLYRQVRDYLIREGLAEERSGFGLAKAETAAGSGSWEQFSNTAAEPLEGTNTGTAVGGSVTIANRAGQTLGDHEPKATEWWVMSSGVARGPYDFSTICRMRQTGDVAPGDVIRQGASGPWQQPDDIPQFALRKRAPIPDISFESAESAKESFIPPDKDWALGTRKSASRLGRGWDIAAGMAGGSRRLLWMLVSAFVIGLFAFWWQQPPPVDTIVSEFNGCYTSLQKLRERKIGRSEWAPTVNRYRPRIEAIVNRLKYRGNPVEKELWLAGSQGLLPLLNIPTDPTEPERIFEQHMESVRRQSQR